MRHRHAAGATTPPGPVKLALALVLNGLLLAWLLPWLRRQWRENPAPVWRGVLVLGLGARLLVGGAKSWNLVKDGVYISELGRLLTAQLWADPAGAWQSLTGNELRFAGSTAVYYGMSNTFFLSKVLAVFNLATGGIDWLNGLYLSLATFVAGWAAVQALVRAFPKLPAGVGMLAFLAWPSVVWFGSGVTKEAALLATGAGVFALFIELIYNENGLPRSSWQCGAQAAALLALAVLHFKLRYFFAAPLLVLLAGVAVLRGLQGLRLLQSRAAQIVLLLSWLLAGAWLASEVSVAFRANKFTNQLALIYARHLRASAGRPHFEYPDLLPTPASIVRHAPLAAFNALSRPWLGETEGRPLYVAGALETSALLLLLGATVVGWFRRHREAVLPFALRLALGLHCLLMAVLLGLSTPNLGSLARYRAVVLPWLLLLLLPAVTRLFNPKSGA